MPSLSFVVGQRLREIRRERSISADAIAQGALVVGIQWDRTIVSKIERGDRALSVDELFALPTILWAAGCDHYHIKDMIPEEASITIGDMMMSGKTLRSLMGSEMASEDIQELVLANKRATLATTEDAPEVDPVEIKRASKLEAERKAARSLSDILPNIDAEVVALFSYYLWGESLTARREKIVNERYPKATVRQLQAERGHVTRVLVGALREYLTELVKNESGKEAVADG